MISDCRCRTNFRPSAAPVANCAFSPNRGIRRELSSRLRSQACPERTTNLESGIRRRSVQWTVRRSAREKYTSSFRNPVTAVAEQREAKERAKTIATAPSCSILPGPENDGGGKLGSSWRRGVGQEGPREKKAGELEARVGIVVAPCRNFVVPAERCVVCFSKLQTIIPKTMRCSWLLRHAQVRCLRAIVHSRCSAGSQRSFLPGLRA